MIDIQYDTESHEIKGNGEIVYGRFYTHDILVQFDPVADANFIELKKKNDDGTYHLRFAINQYIEPIELCPNCIMKVPVVTTDNLIDNGLICIGTQIIEIDNVKIKEM